MKTAPTQFHYQIRRDHIDRVKPEELKAIAEEWTRTGKHPDWIRIRATVWGEKLTDAQTRRRLVSKSIPGAPGIIRHLADPRMTLCDYDSPKAPDLSRFWQLARRLGFKPLAIEYHRTRRGWHVATRWNRRFTPDQIITLQTLLGSDPARECFNFLRVDAGGADTNRHWNILFERKL
jgi:hypothetical protein